MSGPRLRGNAPRREEPYPLGVFPESVLFEIGRQCVHRMAIGSEDLSGDDFGNVFAMAVGGEHRASPLGVADVVKGTCAWSVKTVKAKVPSNRQQVRLISGRNSPDYSFGISDPREDPNKTGSAVLSIWNARVNEALEEFDDLRIVVMIRNFPDRRFLIFEDEARRFIPSDFRWQVNAQNNLEGIELLTDRHAFTWQPHGGQFTVIRRVPGSARNFNIAVDVPVVEPSDVLTQIGFTESWIEIVET